MTDWLETCRGAVADVERGVHELQTRPDRGPVAGLLAVRPHRSGLLAGSP